MKIDTVRLVNYRRYADLTLDFNAKFNVLAGINGSGKTSILGAICEIFAGITENSAVQGPSILGDSGLVRILPVDNAGLLRFEPQYPVQVKMSGYAFGERGQWAVQKESVSSSGQFNENVLDQRGVLSYTGFSSLFAAYLGLNATDSPANSNIAINTLPLLLFYRANRHWNQAPSDEVQSALLRNSRLDAYKSWWDASLDSVALQAWVVGKCLERYQRSSETGIAFNAIDDDELAMVNGALSKALPECKGLRYDMRQRALLLEMNDGTASFFANLSDGQQGVVGLLNDIARRICLLNPMLGMHAMRDTPGVVLIDELDMHLHPSWQRAITRGLKNAFPSLQFIVSSHSPQVLGELTPDEIILLSKDATSHPEASYGLDSSTILEEVMDAPVRSEPVQRLLDKLFATLARNDLALARQHIDEISALAPDLPEIVKAEAMVRRKEIIGR